MLVRLLTSPPICEALADDALQDLGGALSIADAKPGALVVSEVEFAQVAL